MLILRIWPEHVQNTLSWYWDQLMDTTVRYWRISFLDATQGYHQITLALEDQGKIAFTTPKGNYHYTVMPFGLKNVGATYQRMVTRMFKELIGRTVEVYIDDIVVKTREEGKQAHDLQRVFDILKLHKLCLNTEKCAFGVRSGKFFGYMITTRGIEVDPNQVTTI